jgi:hypothetical protein
LNRKMHGWWPLALLGLVGCGAAPGAAAGPVALDAPVTVVADGQAPTSSMQLQASGGFEQQPQQISLKIKKIQLLAQTGAHPRLDELELPLGDLDVPASALPPSGLKLRDLTLRLPAGVEAQVVHEQADALELEVKTPLELDWSLALDNGSLYPLGPARTEPLRLDLDVVRGESGTVVTVSAHCDGTCWSLPGLAQLENGSLYVEAPADVTAAR